MTPNSPKLSLEPIDLKLKGDGPLLLVLKSMDVWYAHVGRILEVRNCADLFEYGSMHFKVTNYLRWVVAEGRYLLAWEEVEKGWWCKRKPRDQANMPERSFQNDRHARHQLSFCAP